MRETHYTNNVCQPESATNDLQNSSVSRRDFVKMTVATGLLVGAGSPTWGAETKGGMPYRTLGRTGD